MGKNKVTQFSMLTLSAVITVVAVGMAVLRLGSEHWQVAAAIVATLVFFGMVLTTRSSKHRSILLSIPAVLLWLGVGGFLRRGTFPERRGAVPQRPALIARASGTSGRIDP